MFSLSGKVPGYLLGKYQMTAIVVFTLLFATVFILLAAPYPGNTFFILATLILALSRFILSSYLPEIYCLVLVGGRFHKSALHFSQES